ncbi:MAG TPA: AMP-binding protein [Stellaceae bacterium]|jgi:2-aminobenzoate-CoA ligase|nr:AMP-binding protein [Stellaceae bacterium]
MLDSTLDPSAHLDSFARDNLPPRALWPEMDFSLPELAYPKRLNAAVELLDRMVERGFADRPCIRWPGGMWSYGELLDKANRIAGVLVGEMGLVPGNRVLLRAANNPMHAACWFAVMKAGGIAVGTMPLLRARELSYIIERAKVEFSLCDNSLSADLGAAKEKAPTLRKIVYFHDDGADGLEARMAAQRPGFANVATSHDDVALIAFTSGTTGPAKGTMHFHRDVLAICDAFPKYVLKPAADDIFVGSPPLAFTFGLGGVLLFPMRVGASTLLLEKTSAEILLQAIQDHRATICFTAPTMFRLMAELAPHYDLASLKKCVSAGETLPLPVFQAFHKATGIRIIDGLGSTEMLHIFVAAAGDDIRPGATGKAIPGYQAIVVDEAGNEVPRNTVGRLAVRGPTGCRYLDDARQTTYVQHGWNLTGDAYRMDEDGYLWYQARTDDMIISAGYNISGPEVEAVLLDHPKVRECAVIGAPDTARGQIVKAFVVKREDGADGDLAKELQDFVKAQIAPYKYPRAIEFVAALPRTETGKVQRFRLRELERERAGRGETKP